VLLQTKPFSMNADKKPLKQSDCIVNKKKFLPKSIIWTVASIG